MGKGSDTVAGSSGKISYHEPSWNRGGDECNITHEVSARGGAPFCAASSGHWQELERHPVVHSRLVETWELAGSHLIETMEDEGREINAMMDWDPCTPLSLQRYPVSALSTTSSIPILAL